VLWQKDSAWVRNHENIFVLGPTGVGKSFIASAPAQKACRDGHSALYLRAAALLRELALARADGCLRNFLARLGRIDVLVIDDWAMAPLNENERREVWEICEDRYHTRSTVVTSQLPASRRHEQIGDPPSPMASWTVWFTTPTGSRVSNSHSPLVEVDPAEVPESGRGKRNGRPGARLWSHL
jgi:DNA replication protein DnaC